MFPEKITPLERHRVQRRVPSGPCGASSYAEPRRNSIIHSVVTPLIFLATAAATRSKRSGTTGAFFRAKIYFRLRRIGFSLSPFLREFHESTLKGKREVRRGDEHRIHYLRIFLPIRFLPSHTDRKIERERDEGGKREIRLDLFD